MPKSYFFPVVLSLMAIPALPLAAAAVAVQQDPVAGQPLDSWWAKFPAPPEGAASFHLEIPPVAAFRSVPLEDD